ncbi:MULTISPECIES: hypothetical protein [unclassified Nonomuraea]|nr:MULTISPECIES: hypothetical protein [unclassified Nonomuraea]
MEQRPPHRRRGGAVIAVRLATLGAGGHTGSYQRDDGVLPG